MRKIEAFIVGLGLGYGITKYNVIQGIGKLIIEIQRRKEIENARIFDPFGDEIIG